MVFSAMRQATQQLKRSAQTVATRRAASCAASFTAASAVSRPSRTFLGAEATRVTRPHVRADVTAVVAGVAVVGAVLGVGKMWWDAAGSGSGSAPQEFQEIPQVDVVLFFAELTAEVKNLLNQVPEIENAVRQYMVENKVELGEPEFKQAILQQLYQMMEGLEQQVVAKRQWSRKSLEHALEKYAEDPEVVALQQELNSVMQTVFPAPEPVEVPADLTADKTLKILKVMVQGMEKAMKDMLHHARSEGITDVVKAMEEFQYLYMEHVEQMTQAQMKAEGISQETFTAALQKYHGESEQFREQVTQIYEEQAKAFQKMGIPVETP